MKKLAVIDLMFRWPPDGGARMDVKDVVSRLAKRYQVKLFVPKIDCIIKRGEIEGNVGFEVVPIAFSKSQFTGPVIIEKFKSAIDEFDPDAVFIADGFSLKPWVVQAVKNRPYFVRFYAYENLCNRDNGIFMRGSRSCYRTGLKANIVDKLYCNACAMRQQLRCVMTRQPSGLTEYLGAKAWQLKQWSRVQKMLDGARNIIVYNTLLKEILQEKGWDASVVPGGISPEIFPFQKPRKPDGVLRLGVIGRINDFMKGSIHAVRAMSILQQQGIETELHLTGSPTKDSLDLPGVKYRGWFRHDELHTFYESVDIVIVPSIWQEPFGLVTLEAMASGRPVVGSSVAGQKEIITHGHNGLLAIRQSAQSIAEQVLVYMQDAELQKRIVKNASEYVIENCRWDTIVEKHYLPVIESLLME